MSTFKGLKMLSPDEIRPNYENPRAHFPELTMETLTESIDETGVLVPVTVFADPEENPTPYVLIDGERRWRCSVSLGLELIPANVLDKPDTVENLVTMFNIHMVREPWDDMPTARALGKVMQRTGITDVEQLHRKTGLSKTKIKQYQHALTLPPEYQQLIEDGIIPLNYFTELRKHLLSPLQRRRPKLYDELGEEQIIASFVQKRLDGVNTDTVELRNISPIINVAFDEAGGSEQSTDLDEVIRDLVTVPGMSVSQAYQNSVEMVVEAGKFAEQCMQLVQRLDRLLAKVGDSEEEAIVTAAVNRLIVELDSRLHQDIGKDDE